MSTLWLTILYRATLIGVFGFLVADPVLALTYRGWPWFVNTGQEKSKRVITYILIGADSDEKLTEPVADIAGRYGLVRTIVYDSRRFRPRLIVRAVRKRIVEDNPDVALIFGASTGGRLAADLLLRHRGCLPRQAVILNDVPMSGRSLMDRKAWISLFWHPGPIANLLLTRLFWRFGGREMSENPGDPLYNPDKRKAAFAVAQSYPLSGFGGQVRYLLLSRRVPPERLYGTPAFYIQSLRDDTVKRSARDEWAEAYGGFVASFEVNARHIDYLADPSAFLVVLTQAFEAALDALGVNPQDADLTHVQTS